MCSQYQISKRKNNKRKKNRNGNRNCSSQPLKNRSLVFLPSQQQQFHPHYIRYLNESRDEETKTTTTTFCTLSHLERRQSGNRSAHHLLSANNPVHTHTHTIAKKIYYLIIIMTIFFSFFLFIHFFCRLFSFCLRAEIVSSCHLSSTIMLFWLLLCLGLFFQLFFPVGYITSETTGQQQQLIPSSPVLFSLLVSCVVYTVLAAYIPNIYHLYLSKRIGFLLLIQFANWETTAATNNQQQKKQTSTD